LRRVEAKLLVLIAATVERVNRACWRIGSAALALAFVAALVGLGLAGTVIASAHRPGEGRGNESRVEGYPWGWRIWLDHDTILKIVYEEEEVSNGELSDGRSHMPGGNQVIAYINCAVDFVNALRDDDAGHGIVADVKWSAPLWTCDNTKVSGQ
jgi:hypothetical protein